MKGVHPYLNFPGNTEEVLEFYRTVFGGDFLGIFRYRDFGGEAMGASGAELDKIAHMALPLTEGTMLMATDSIGKQAQTLTTGNNIYFNLDAESVEEAERLFRGLSEGGETEMPLQATEWAELYGSCIDRYGVRWMVNFEGDVQMSPGGAA